MKFSAWEKCEKLILRRFAFHLGDTERRTNFSAAILKHILRNIFNKLSSIYVQIQP